MAEIFRCVKEDIILSPVLHADIYVCLCNVNVFGSVKVINTLTGQIFISEVEAFALLSVINGNYFIGYYINFIFVLIKEIGKILKRIRCKSIIGVKENKILTLSVLYAEITGL